MKAAKAILCLFVFVLAATPSTSALAWRGGHARVGVYIGGPAYWYPPYYYPPYYSPYYPYPAYAYPPAVVMPSTPQTYIEQGGGPPAAAQAQPPSQAQSSQSQANWWHYCADSKAYYPYVKECPAGWQRVAPQPQQ